MRPFDVARIPDKGSILLVLGSRGAAWLLSDLFARKPHLPVLSTSDPAVLRKHLRHNMCAILDCGEGEVVFEHTDSTQHLLIVCVRPVLHVPLWQQKRFDFVILCSDIPEKHRARVFSDYGIFFTGTMNGNKAIVLDNGDGEAYLWEHP